MTDKSTPSYKEFVRRHRSSEHGTVHEQAQLAAECTFDWIGVPAAGIAEGTIGALVHHQTDARGPRPVQ
jgi:hypothetical protein